MCFSHTNVWHFIAELLENGHPFEEKILKKPPGATAYEAWFKVTDGKVIYNQIAALWKHDFWTQFPL